ncbi:hypothetical protein ACI2LF_06285 [Kribbella sp. NPDC020789]
MPKSRRRKKERTSGSGSGRQPYQPPAQPVVHPAPETPPPTPTPTPAPPPASDHDLRARADGLLRRPGSDPAKWAADVAALLAEFESRRQYRAQQPPNYDHLPPLENLVHPWQEPAATEYKGPWHIASQRAAEAYERLRAEVERLGTRLHRDLANPRAAEPADRLVPLTVDRRDTYLATKSAPIDPIDSGDLYRYAKGNPEALERIERLRTGRTSATKWVTPGYHWWMERTDGLGRRETVEITLTVNAEGIPQLRCRDICVAATVENWIELTTPALPERPFTPVRPTPPAAPAATPSRLRRFAAEFTSAEGWIGLLLIALAASIAVVILLALSKL